MDAKERIDQEIIKQVIAEADREHAEYSVASGARVHLQYGEYVVAEVILSKEQQEKFKPDHVWKLFTLVSLSGGTNWAYPIPAMSEGTMDIRKLVEAGQIRNITYKEGAGQKTRVYQVEDVDGNVYIMTVTQNRGL